MKKFTKKQMFEVVKSNAAAMTLPEGITAEMVVQFAEREIELLSKPSAPTAQQKENAEIKAKIVETINAAGRPMGVAEVIEIAAPGLTSQRVSALLKQLVEAGEIGRIEPKGKEKVAFTKA